MAHHSSAHRPPADIRQRHPSTSIFHHQNDQKQHQRPGQFGRSDGAAAAHYTRGHQRRQSVARLLPDISKLRLLSWLVEASNELINCDIAIMDGVYAKLNRSRESLLFWQQNQTATSSNPVQGAFNPSRLPPTPPSVQPVANRIVISQRRQLQKQPTRSAKLSGTSGGQQKTRNHHSLPLTNYDAASLAAISLRSSKTMPTDSDSIVGSSSTCSQPPMSSKQQGQQTGCYANVGQPIRLSIQENSPLPVDMYDTASINNHGINNNDDYCDSNQSDDDDNSSAASSTTSSGIHGASLSSSSSSSTSSSVSSSAGSSCSNAFESSAATAADQAPAAGIGPNSNNNNNLSSAEYLSERIRSTLMEHNYLQNLLVNIIRQHDRQRDLFHQQRRRQTSSGLDQFSRSSTAIQQQLPRIDLADIADALDDGCLCSCHSQQQSRQRQQYDEPSSSAKQPIKASTLPSSAATPASSSLSLFQPQNLVSSRKTSRRLKKIRGNNSSTASEPSREDMIQQLSDKLCENCFETHYWLHGCSLIELMQSNQKSSKRDHHNSLSSSILLNNPNSLSQQQQQQYDSNSITSLRNATFIKLVQQQVRSTISKSIELIDLIRKEIKSPESIKQKQLMRCFSSSIQLLSSVANYVVPSQDISSFIPEVEQRQTTLFSLPSSDFDHLLLYPTSSSSSPSVNATLPSAFQINQTNNLTSYHLAPAPEIPTRRRFCQQPSPSETARQCDTGESSRSMQTATNSNQLNTSSQQTDLEHDSQQRRQRQTSEQLLSSNLQKLKTDDNKINQTIDSSSGASSNNSSASSSIARGQVQQSSLTRAHTSSAILDGKTSHDLSFETIASLSRQQTEDDSLFQSRPKFWQSSKFNFIRKLLHVKQQRLLRQQSKDRRIYNNKVQNKFRLVMMDLTHFNKSQQLLTTENGVNSLLTSMRNVLEFGLYLTLKLY